MNDIIWRPNPGPQTLALQTTTFETLYGGARGGGKTDAGLVWLVKPYLLNNPRARALVIRKNADDLADWLDRARYYYKRYGGVVAGKPAVIAFPSGYKIRTGHLKDDNAYTKYQGQEYQRIVIEELTQIPNERSYLSLIASCRSTVDGIDPRVFCTTNPGGVGHTWVKKRFIDICPPEQIYNFTLKLQNGNEVTRSRIFIPAKMDDNPVLMEKDPGYVATIEMMRDVDEEKWKAWRLGDWDTFAGQYFREFRRDKHVVRRFTPSSNLIKIGGLDWGRTDPFAFVASIVYPVHYTGVDKSDPLNIGTEIRDFHFYRSITYQEVYGTEKKPSDWSIEIKKHVNLAEFRWVQADNQIYNPGLDDNSMSIFEQFCQEDPRWRSLLKPASKERIGGWENLHNWLSFAPDGIPYWLITENCINLIRTLPELIHDELNVEDVDSTGEDHAPDAVRYQFKALKWIDGKLGGIKSHPTPKHHASIKGAPTIINTDAFAISAKKQRDWRSV